MKESSVIGLKVTAKFFLSKDPKNEYKCISRTLGKLSIANLSSGKVVKDQEIWLCKIMHETKPGKNHGIFILDPIDKIDPLEVKKLIPGFYYEPTAIGKTLIIRPKEDEKPSYWVLSRDTRRAYSDRYHTVIVPHTIESLDESQNKEDQ